MEDESARAGGQVADEELRLLEAMAAVSRGMQQELLLLLLLLGMGGGVTERIVTHLNRIVLQMNQVLSTLNRQTVELSQELATAERQMNALYLPFQAAIYEMQSSSTNAMTTTPAAARYADR